VNDKELTPSFDCVTANSFRAAAVGGSIACTTLIVCCPHSHCVTFFADMIIYRRVRQHAPHDSPLYSRFKSLVAKTGVS